MLDKPLDHAEQELLNLIRQLYDGSGPILRTRLSVVGRGRGLDVARLLVRLKTLGLVEEYEQRPSWIRWFLGARSQMMLRPLAARVSEPASATLPEAVPATELAPDAENPVPPGSESGAGIADARIEAAGENLPQPEPVPEPQPLPVAETAPVAAMPQAIAQAPVMAAAPVEVQAAAPARPRPVPSGYADEIGGAPLATPPAYVAAGLDPELLEGLSDFLATLGMEMTMAGEALAADRMARGAPAGDSLMQLVLFAFAHAARFDMVSSGPADAAELYDYAASVLTELGRLQEAGEISAGRFAADQSLILELADNRGDRSLLVAQLLADPVGGAAPPALLPAELRGLEEVGEEEE